MNSGRKEQADASEPFPRVNYLRRVRAMTVSQRKLSRILSARGVVVHVRDSVLDVVVIVVIVVGAVPDGDWGDSNNCVII